MELDFGMIITIVAFALFYLRLAMLRGKKRRELREMQLKVKHQGKGAKMTVPEENRPGYEIKSWVLVVLAGVFMIAGMMARQNASFPDWAHQYWWIGTVLGALLLGLSFK